MRVVYFFIAVTLAAVSDVASLPGQGELSVPACTIEQPRVWSKCAIKYLLVNVKQHQHLLTDKQQKNKPVWSEVATAMNDLIPGISAEQCDQKWRNIKQTFRKYVDHLKKKDCRKMSKPKFYDEIAEIIGGSRTADPTSTLNITTIPSCSTAVTVSSPAEKIGRSSTANPGRSTAVTASSPAESSETASTAGDTGGQPSFPPAEPVHRRKKLKRDYSIERLEEQIDRLIEDQAAATENSQRQFGEMLVLFERQHRERMTVMNKLIKAVSAAHRNSCKHDSEDEELRMTVD